MNNANNNIVTEGPGKADRALEKKNGIEAEKSIILSKHSLIQ
jgi:hypothetical protein